MRRPDLCLAPIGDLWVELSVEKLRHRYDPFSVLGIPQDRQHYASVEPAEYVPEDHRWSAYSVPRVAYHMRHGWDDPISVDWYWRNGLPERPLVTDGHHRFCAAILLGDSRIVVNYSGPVLEIDALA